MKTTCIVLLTVLYTLIAVLAYAIALGDTELSIRGDVPGFGGFFGMLTILGIALWPCVLGYALGILSDAPKED